MSFFPRPSMESQSSLPSLASSPVSSSKSSLPSIRSLRSKFSFAPSSSSKKNLPPSSIPIQTKDPYKRDSLTVKSKLQTSNDASTSAESIHITSSSPPSSRSPRLGGRPSLDTSFVASLVNSTLPSPIPSSRTSIPTYFGGSRSVSSPAYSQPSSASTPSSLPTSRTGPISLSDQQASVAPILPELPRGSLDIGRHLDAITEPSSPPPLLRPNGINRLEEEESGQSRPGSGVDSNMGMGAGVRPQVSSVAGDKPIKDPKKANGPIQAFRAPSGLLAKPGADASTPRAPLRTSSVPSALRDSNDSPATIYKAYGIAYLDARSTEAAATGKEAGNSRSQDRGARDVTVGGEEQKQNVVVTAKPETIEEETVGEEPQGLGDEVEAKSMASDVQGTSTPGVVTNGDGIEEENLPSSQASPVDEDEDQDQTPTEAPEEEEALPVPKASTSGPLAETSLTPVQEGRKDRRPSAGTVDAVEPKDVFTSNGNTVTVIDGAPASDRQQHQRTLTTPSRRPLSLVIPRVDVTTVETPPRGDLRHKRSRSLLDDVGMGTRHCDLVDQDWPDGASLNEWDHEGSITFTPQRNGRSSPRSGSGSSPRNSATARASLTPTDQTSDKARSRHSQISSDIPSEDGSPMASLLMMDPLPSFASSDSDLDDDFDKQDLLTPHHRPRSVSPSRQSLGKASLLESDGTTTTTTTHLTRPASHSTRNISPRTAKRWSIDELEKAYDRMKNMISRTDTEPDSILEEEPWSLEGRDALDELNLETAFERALNRAESLKAESTPRNRAMRLSSGSLPDDPEFYRHLTGSASPRNSAQYEEDSEVLAPSVVETSRNAHNGRSPRAPTLNRRHTINDRPSQEELRTEDAASTVLPTRSATATPTIAMQEPGENSADSRPPSSLASHESTKEQLQLGPSRRVVAKSVGHRTDDAFVSRSDISGWDTPRTTVSQGKTEDSLSVRPQSRSGSLVYSPASSMRSTVGREWVRSRYTRNNTAVDRERERAPPEPRERSTPSPIGYSSSSQPWRTAEDLGDPIRPDRRWNRSPLAHRNGNGNGNDGSMSSAGSARAARLLREAEALSYSDRRSAKSVSPTLHKRGGSSSWWDDSVDRGGVGNRPGIPAQFRHRRNVSGAVSENWANETLEPRELLEELRGLDKIELCLRVSALQSELETTRRQARLEREALLDALKETRTLVDELRSEREASSTWPRHGSRPSIQDYYPDQRPATKATMARNGHSGRSPRTSLDESDRRPARNDFGTSASDYSLLQRSQPVTRNRSMFGRTETVLEERAKTPSATRPLPTSRRTTSDSVSYVPWRERKLSLERGYEKPQMGDDDEVEKSVQDEKEDQEERLSATSFPPKLRLSTGEAGSPTSTEFAFPDHMPPRREGWTGLNPGSDQFNLQLDPRDEQFLRDLEIDARSLRSRVSSFAD